MSGPEIARLESRSLRDGAYRALHDAFTRGAFAPGDVVSLRMLAEQLGISMTPVREAVRRLVAEGALLDTPSRTLMVPPFDARRMADLKTARLALEPEVLRQAAGRMDASDRATLRAIIASAPQSATPDLATNYRFHFTLYRHSGSDVLLPLVESLWLQYGAYLNRIIAQKEARAIAHHTHHLEILDALDRDDPDDACAALASDIERSFRLLPAAGGPTT